MRLYKHGKVLYCLNIALISRSCFSLIIHSIATCLGARTVAAKALEWTRNHKVINHVCSDEEAVLACERFAGKQNFVFHFSLI